MPPIPPRSAMRSSRPGGGIGHIAWLADSLDEEVARLRHLGIEPFHAGRTGPASAVWFDGGALFGHPIEVLQRREEILGFYEMVRSCSRRLGRIRTAASDDGGTRVRTDRPR